MEASYYNARSICRIYASCNKLNYGLLYYLFGRFYYDQQDYLILLMNDSPKYMGDEFALYNDLKKRT